MTVSRFLPVFAAIACGVGAISPAHAWDPNEGADAPVVARPAPRLPTYVVPSRFYSNPYTAPASAPASYAPVAAAPPVAPITYAAPVAPAPTYAAPTATYTAPAAPAVAYAAPAAAAAPAPAYTPPPSPYPVAPVAAPIGYAAQPYDSTPDAPTRKAYQHYVGVEVFHDHYEEPDTFPDLNTNAIYGAIDAGVTHYFTPTVFGTAEGRLSYGRENYKSNSGSLHDVPQWEGDVRFLAGYDSAPTSTRRLKPYIGLGTRYYIDEAKGGVTNLGALAYERRILQVYMPIGVTYEFPAYGFMFAPNIEVDPLLYGHVDSRLQSFGVNSASNRQVNGIGMRAEFMASKLMDDGTAWQFGPFIRYWDIDDSRNDASAGAFEPRNTRLQAGAKVKYLF